MNRWIKSPKLLDTWIHILVISKSFWNSLESLRGLFSGNNCLIRIEELCSSNDNQLKNLDATLEQFKNKVQNSASQLEHQVSIYGKDSQYLKENIVQVRNWNFRELRSKPNSSNF